MFKKNFQPYKQSARSGGSLVSFSKRNLDVKDSGQDVSFADVSMHEKVAPLPPPENFSLEAQIASGVPLKDVSSVVFHTNEVTPDLEAKIEQSIQEPETDENESNE